MPGSSRDPTAPATESLMALSRSLTEPRLWASTWIPSALPASSLNSPTISSKAACWAPL